MGDIESARKLAALLQLNRKQLVEMYEARFGSKPPVDMPHGGIAMSIVKDEPTPPVCPTCKREL